MAKMNRLFWLVVLALGMAPLSSLAASKARPKVKPNSVTAKAPATANQGATYNTRPDAMQMAESIAERRDLDPNWVRKAIGSSRYMPQIGRWVLPAASPAAKNWRVYRSRFIDPVRIEAGVVFWQQHASALERAEKEFGVPAEIIVGIIGVETIYGRDMGSFRVMDALTTLSFDFPASHPRAGQRQAFFLGELEQLLSLAFRMGVDPMGFKGSYAGAMGLAQFMPTSWVRWAIDFDGDGKVDLFNSPIDAIGSVANYFRGHGWQPGMATHYPAQFDAGRLDLEALLAPDILPTFSSSSMVEKGVVLDSAAAAHSGKLALIELLNGPAAASYVIGTDNFYAITRYNWSSYYAMAVIELGREVTAARRRP